MRLLLGVKSLRSVRFRSNILIPEEAGRSVKFAKLYFQFKEFWSVQMLSPWPFMYGRNWRMVHTIAMHLSCVVL